MAHLHLGAVAAPSACLCHTVASRPSRYAKHLPARIDTRTMQPHTAAQPPFSGGGWCCRRSRRLSPAAGSSPDADAAVSTDRQLRDAVRLLADTFLRDEIALGVGSGKGVSCLLEELATRRSVGKLRSVRVVPGSAAAASEAAYHGIPIAGLQDVPKLDVFVEVADELCADPGANLAFIIGRRQRPTQPQLHRSRELAAAAQTNVVLAESLGVLVPRLGGSLLVAVEEEGWEEAGEELDDIFLGDAELWRRSNEDGAGPRGGDNPYISEEGHALIDIRFYEGLKLFGEDADYAAIAREIEGVPGVVAHGLMANVAAAAVVAAAGGPQLAWRGDDLRHL